jgi:hypothetical protein
MFLLQSGDFDILLRYQFFVPLAQYLVGRILAKGMKINFE